MTATNREAHPRESLGELPDLTTRIVMLVGGLMVTMALSSIAPVLPEIEAALATTADEKLLVKMMVPFAGAAMVVGAPLTGFLVDRIGLRSLLIVYGSALAVAGTAGFYLDSLYLLLATRVFVGFSAAGLATISMTLINTRLQGNTRARWMGFHIATAMLGALVILPTTGALGEIGWRWPFLIYALGFLVTLLGFFVVLPPSPSAPAHDGKAGLALGNPLKWFPLWYLPLALVVGSITYLPTVYLAFVARDAGVSSPSTVSLIMLADAIIGAMMALLFGWSQKRISSAAAFTFSFACTGTGMVVAGLADGMTQIVVGMLIFGSGIGWFMPNVMTSLSRRVTQSEQGSAVGILKSTHFLASPLAVLAVEPISRMYGGGGALVASAFVSFCAVAVFGTLAARDRASRDTTITAGAA